MKQLVFYLILLFLSSYSGQLAAQHTLDFYIPPCPYVGIIDEGPPPSAIRVFPQPAINELTIAFDDPGITGVGTPEISMYNIMGRLLIRETAAPGATTHLDVSAVPPGVYLLQIQMDQRRYNKRIIVADK